MRELLIGNEHFALYYRTLAWDHAPGAFLAQQAGAALHRFDGSRYCPGDGGSDRNEFFGHQPEGVLERRFRAFEFV